MKRITVSFKNTTKDIKLYTYIKSQEEQSVFIKKAVEHYINFIEGKKNV
ncbi:hypothetical protein [Clostridium tetani]|nr:hypothetical protein [Clostridium tetani]